MMSFEEIRALIQGADAKTDLAVLASAVATLAANINMPVARVAMAIAAKHGAPVPAEVGAAVNGEPASL